MGELIRSRRADMKRPKPIATDRRRAPKPAAGGRARAPAPAEGARKALQALLAPVSVAADPIVPGAALRVEDIDAFWTWFARDVSAEFANELEQAVGSDGSGVAELAGRSEDLVNLSKHTVDAAAETGAGHRLVIQLGGEAEFAALPSVLTCLANLRLLERAGDFGRAINAMDSVPSVAEALKAVALPDPALKRFWLATACRTVADPRKFLSAAVVAAGRQSVKAVREAGFGECFEAFLIDAQRQAITLSDRAGLFADIDLACRATQRFHSIARAIRYCFDLQPNAPWAFALSQLTRQIATAMEPHLGQVTADVIRVLRPPRDGADRLSDDALLQAFNGLYLLSAARDSRESLALNRAVERAWGEIGVAIESLGSRAIEAYRSAPDDELASRRIDAAIKMAAVRFGPEYARVLARSRDNAGRRHAGEGGSRLAQQAN